MTSRCSRTNDVLRRNRENTSLTIVVDDELEKDNELDANSYIRGYETTYVSASLDRSERETERIAKNGNKVSEAFDREARKGSSREGNIGLVTLDKRSVSLSRLDDRDREIFKRDLGKRRNRQWEIAKRRLREKGLLLR